MITISSYQRKSKCATNSKRWKKTAKTIMTPTINIKTFVDETICSMDILYPYWQQKFRNEVNRETFCLPIYLDENCTGRGCPIDIVDNVKSFAVDVKQKFIQAFRKMEIGGFLVGGLNLKDMLSVMLKLDQETWNITSREAYDIEKESTFQKEDFIFVHPRYGITIFQVIMTVNANTKLELSTQHKDLEQSVSDLKINLKFLPELFRLLTQTDCPIEINVGICYPQINEALSQTLTPYLPIIDGDIFHSMENLRSFVMQNFTLTHHPHMSKGENNTLLTQLTRFAAGLIGIRSTKNFSDPRNAFTAHGLLHKIDRVFSTHRNPFSSLLRMPISDQTVLLTAEQVTILEDDSPWQIITGPPGSGKTLLLLLKALEAARRPGISSPIGEGRVIVISTNAALIKNFVNIFEFHRDVIIRKPIFFDANSEWEILPIDDMFCDEPALINIAQILYIRMLFDNGTSTVIAVSENIGKNHSTNLEDVLRAERLDYYRHFALNVIIRSTIEIIDTFKSELSEKISGDQNIGSRICGFEVLWPTGLTNQEQLLDCLFENLKPLIDIASCTEAQLALKDIAIITDNEGDSQMIIAFLRSLNVRCGTLEDQANDTNLIVIVWNDCRLLSAEWPIVILVALCNIDIRRSFFLVAASRAMAHLIVIARDYMVVQKTLDSKFFDDSGTESDLEKFAKLFSVERAGMGNNERDIDCFILRKNLFFVSSSTTAIKLTALITALSANSDACIFLMKAMKYRTNYFPKRKTKLLKTLWSEMDAKENEQLWQAFMQLRNKFESLLLDASDSHQLPNDFKDFDYLLVLLPILSIATGCYYNNTSAEGYLSTVGVNQDNKLLTSEKRWWTQSRANYSIVCRNCWALIIGERNSCTVCKNCELCRHCVYEAGHNTHHVLIKSTIRFTGIRSDFVCDECKYKISGYRFHCKICRNYDFCSSCFEENFAAHQKFHQEGSNNKSILLNAADEAILQKLEEIFDAYPDVDFDDVFGRLSTSEDISGDSKKIIEELKEKKMKQEEEDQKITLPEDDTAEVREPVDYFETALFWLDQAHIGWREGLTSEFGQTDTICIPDCLDVNPNKYFGPTKPNATGYDKNLMKKFKPNLKGESGEEPFFHQFRKLKIGGILIHSFDSQDFIKVMCTAGLTSFNDLNETWKNEKRHFECDFIFIHKSFGFVVIEAKACDRKQEVFSRYKHATEQLQRRIPGLIDLFLRISSESDCPFNMQGVICMPNVIVNNIAVSRAGDNNEPETSFRLLDGAVMHNVQKFEEFWMTLKHENKTFHEKEATAKFICALIAYRSTAFLSATCNALEIYRRITKQEFKNKKMDDLQAVFYNEDQMKVIESDARRLLITGPPGTGKTLCLIQRVLNAANITKSGRVLISTSYAPLLFWLFRRSFNCQRNSSRYRRYPDFLTPNHCTPEDDFFCDEVSMQGDIVQGDLYTYNLASRPLTSGSTTVVLTGWHDPTEAARTTEAINIYSNFKHIELRTVVRGTKAIINEWNSCFPDRFIRIGHNITGTPVERHSVSSLSEMLEMVRLKVLEQLNALPVGVARHGQVQLYQNLSMLWTPCDIAVITTYLRDKNTSKIEAYLEESGIPCNKIAVNDKTQNSACITVKEPIETLSCEWPIVIAIKVASTRNPLYLVAISRAIAKLIVIEIPDNMQDDEDK